MRDVRNVINSYVEIEDLPHPLGKISIEIMPPMAKFKFSSGNSLFKASTIRALMPCSYSKHVSESDTIWKVV
jgi:hypothetical protein